MTPDEIGQILDQIGERIGPAGQQAFQIMVQQKFAEGVVYTIILSIAVVALIVGGIKAVNLGKLTWEKEKASYESRGGYRSEPDWFPYVMTAVLGGLIGGFILLFIVSMLASNILQMINPAYYAIQDILSALGRR